MRTHALLRLAVLMVCTLLGTLALCQTKPVASGNAGGNKTVVRPTSASASVEHLKSQLYGAVPVAPWSVSEQLLTLALTEHAEDELYKPGVQGLPTNTTFLNPTEVSEYVEKLRNDSIKLSVEELVRSGVPEKVALRVSDNMARPHLVAIREVLLKYAQASDSLSPKKLAATLQMTVQGSMSHLLNNPNPDQLRAVATLLRRAGSTKPTTSGLVSRQLIPAAWNNQNTEAQKEIDATTRPLLLTRPRAIDIAGMEDTVLKCLKTDAQDAYRAIQSDTDPDMKAHVLEVLANGLAARADGAVSQTTNSLSKLKTDESLKVLAAVGQLNDLQKTTMGALYDGGNKLHDGLETAEAVFRSQWESQYKTAFQVKGSSVPEIPPQIDANLAKTAYLFSRLQTISKGQIPTDAIAEISNLLPVNSPEALKIEGLAEGIRSITSADASYAAKGEAVLQTLDSLTGGAIPQLKQVHAAFSALSPLLQAAGPLALMASCTTPIGMLQMAGGLFGGGGPFGGGGGNNDAELAAIKQQLAEINKKLDEVLDRLKRLDQEIKQDHVEVMNALESISFDVQRVHELVEQGQIRDASRDCVGWQESLDGGNLTQTETRYDSCLNSLNSIFEAGAPEFLTAISNLKTDSLKKDAYQKLAAIVQVNAQSMPNAKKNCFSLVLGGNSLAEIETLRDIGEDQAVQDRSASQNQDERAQQNAKNEDSLCQKVLAVNDMLDSSILSYFVNLDLHTTDIKKPPHPNEREVRNLWKKNNLEDNFIRWRKELSYLNIAIGQQALLAGDATAPAWAEKLESDITSADADVLDGQQILAQNAVKYWLQKHVNGFGSQGQYAFSYYACDPEFLWLTTNLTSANVSFDWTNLIENHINDKDATDLCPNAKPSNTLRSTRWCAHFKNLRGCIDLPTPTEKATQEIRRSSNLEMLVAMREAVLTRIETTRLIQQQNPEGRMRILEAMAINWKDKRVQKPKAVRPKAEVAMGDSDHSPFDASH